MTQVQCPVCDGYGENRRGDLCLMCHGDGGVERIDWPNWETLVWLIAGIGVTIAMALI